MLGPLKKPLVGPELGPETIRRVDILFLPEDRERAKDLLYRECGNNLPGLGKLNMYELERFRFAALKCSDGKYPLLEAAVKLAQQDWRDLLVAAGFANDVEAHRRWKPKPAGEPALIDAVRLAAKIHESLTTVLTPLGFAREGDEWRRDGEVPQTLRLRTGLTSRVETRFFLRLTLEAMPRSILLQPPMLPASMAEMSEQGYRIKAGGSEKVLCSAVAADVIRYAQPWFERFTTNEEVQKGFGDGTFKIHVPMGTQVLVLSLQSRVDK